MLREKEYIIEFNKLKAGMNHFEFPLNSEFLQLAGDTTGLKADAKADLELFKTDMMYTLNFHITGKVTLPCDVCLDDFELPIDNRSELILKLSESEQYDDDEIVYISPQAIDYNLLQYLFDCLVLSVPIKKVCSMSGEKTCDPAVVEKLKDLSGSEEDGEDDAEDPRWDKLKDILNN